MGVVYFWSGAELMCVFRTRCRWRRAWTKPSITSAKNWSIRPTTSTSPNLKLHAWRKDGPDTTERACPTTDSPRRMWTLLRGQLFKLHCWPQHSGIWILVFEKQRHVVSLLKTIALPCVGAAAALRVWVSSPRPSLRAGRTSLTPKQLFQTNKSDTQPIFFFVNLCFWYLNCRHENLSVLCVNQFHGVLSPELGCLTFIFSLLDVLSYQWHAGCLVAAPAAKCSSSSSSSSVPERLLRHLYSLCLSGLQCDLLCEISFQDVHYQFQVKMLF